MADSDEVAAISEKIDELQQRLTALRARLPALSDAEALCGELDLLACRVGTEQLAIRLEFVHTVVLSARLTPILEASSWMPGMLSLRGAPVPVIDLWARAQKSARRLLLSDLIVVCQTGNHRLGLVTQSVSQVKRIQASAVQKSLDDVPHAAYVVGTLEIANEPAMLVSVPRLLASLNVLGETP